MTTIKTSREPRQVVIDVLREHATPESHPSLFEDDIVFFSVRLVEDEDPEWLLAQLADTTYPLAGRIEVLGNLSKLQSRGIEILRREDPSVEHLGRGWTGR